MRRFAAALFDVDGTLLDSADFVLGAVEYTLRQHHLTPPPRSELARYMGPALAETYRRLAPHLDAAQLCAMHRAWQQQRVAQQPVRAFPHAAEVLTQLRAAGVRCAAVTARSRVSSLGTIESAGLGGLLELVTSLEDAPRAKPHPDALLLTLSRLGVAACDAVMVGDTAADIAAGRAAGMVTVGVLYGFFGAALAEYHPDYLIADLRELVAVCCPNGC